MITMVEYEKENNIVVTKDNVLELLENNEIKTIYFNAGHTIGDDVTIIETDYDHPFVYDKKPFKALYINEDWFLKNPEEGIELLKIILEHNKSKSLNIYNEALFAKNILEVLKKNEYIEELDLGIHYNLTVEIYELLKETKVQKVSTHGVCEELEDVYEPLIDYNWKKSVIGTSSFNYLPKAIMVEITKIEEFKFIEYLSSTCKIKLNQKNIHLLDELLKLNLPNPIIITLDDKLEFNKYVNERNINGNNIQVKVGLEQVDLSTYIRLEKVLDSMVEGLENLSPFEKYIFIYNEVKQFKEYKESEEKTNARNLYDILENEYMVCVGYARLLTDLCKRVGIDCCEISQGVDISYDKYEKGEEELVTEKSVKNGGHARAYIYIKDPKYGLDGYYLADATWDNDMENDSYHFAALTTDERLAGRRYLMSDYKEAEEYFDSQNLEQFYAKINHQLNVMSAARYQKSKTDPRAYSTNIDDDVNDMLKIIKKLLEKLKELDPEFYKYIEENYSNCIDPSFEEIREIKKQDCYNLISDMGIRITDLNNKKIEGRTLFSAIRVVYQHNGLSGDKLFEELNKTILFNKDRFKRSFPTRNKEYEDGTIEVYADMPNKFDIEEEVHKHK